MNMDVSKTLRSYTKVPENETIKNSKIQLLNQKCYQLLRDLTTTVQFHLSNMRL